MKVIDPGHSYLLDNLKDTNTTVLAFYKDPDLHFGEGWNGPSTQEVLRACIDRVKVLDTELPWWGNKIIIYLLRQAIVLFEQRALERAIQKGVEIENLPTYSKGHLVDL